VTALAALAALAVRRTVGRSVCSVGCAAAPKSIAIRRRGVSDGKSIPNDSRRRMKLCAPWQRRGAGARTARGLRYASVSDRLASSRQSTVVVVEIFVIIVCGDSCYRAPPPPPRSTGRAARTLVINDDDSTTNVITIL